MRTFHVHRIELPSWAKVSPVEILNLSDAEFQAIQQHRGDILSVVQDEVERYLNTDMLVFEEGEEGFPNRGRLTGEYYIGNELYEKMTQQGEGDVVVVGIKTRFLEKPFYPGQDEFDYLGLDVWIACDLSRWTFTICRNTDSSVI
ncbi:MAG: hypothetical protein MN733_19575 [Nitrososphaera sp.]|nr:hypothetical protein [Nitrososphaera sp.]